MMAPSHRATETTPLTDSAAKVLPRAALAALVEESQAAGARVVFTNGVFDLLHLGHIRYLERARALGDLLVVGLNSDTSTCASKGPKRPLVPQDERAATLAALASVDAVTIFDERTAEALVALLRPAIYVKGADYATDASLERTHDLVLAPDALRAALAADTIVAHPLAGLGARLPEARVVAKYGGSVALLAYLAGHSTTALIQRIVSRYGEPAAQSGGGERYGNPRERSADV